MSDSNHPLLSSGRRMLLLAFSAICLSFVLFSCEPETRRARSTDHILMMDAKLIGYNQQLVKSENSEIEDYIIRHHWKMQETSTGLRYMVYKKGNGRKIISGDVVRLKYSLSLLNGNTVYSSDSLGPKIICPGTSEGETGLQEALLLMQQGDCAKLIVPSHLAFGLLGDLKNIPAGAALVYDIEILLPAR